MDETLRSSEPLYQFEAIYPNLLIVAKILGADPPGFDQFGGPL